ncbi:MAG TPA: glycosyltransferase [Longimicrobiaceae bacterium]|nr:glycosyltransferase [Longimicrobiaceae bacterium]
MNVTGRSPAQQTLGTATGGASSERGSHRGEAVLPGGIRAVRVAVCVATLQRPLLLGALLESLGTLEFRKRAPVDLFIVVVDNDGNETAREVVEAARDRLPFPVVYTVEPTRGIPHARNRGVGVALREGAEFVAFIDDDEVASPGWLDELLDVQHASGADVVSGPSLPRFAPEVEQWVIDGGFFTYPRYATGESIPIAATNNVLVSARLFRDRPEPFDPAFGLSGMDDSHFFMRVKKEGAKLVWADEALVEEFIPASRARARWIIRRAFRIGNGYVFCVRTLHPPHRWVVPRVAGALARIGYGALLLPVAAVQGRAPLVGAMRTISNGVGSLVALAGKRYQEYTVIHGR